MASGGGAIYPQETAKALRDVPRSAWECTVISYVYLFFLPKMLLPDSPSRSPIDAANWRSSSFCEEVRFFGVLTFTVTNWSPRPLPRTYGMPFPRRRKVVPLCVPSGMVSFTLPSSVGTSISAPSVA